MFGFGVSIFPATENLGLAISADGRVQKVVSAITPSEIRGTACRRDSSVATYICDETRSPRTQIDAIIFAKKSDKAIKYRHIQRPNAGVTSAR